MSRYIIADSKNVVVYGHFDEKLITISLVNLEDVGYVALPNVFLPTNEYKC